MEEIRGLRLQSGDLTASASELTRGLTGLDAREAEHWDAGQHNWVNQMQSHSELENFVKALREEFISHQEFQRSEGERLRQYSTQRFLEQMDKALNLEKDNCQLTDSLKKMELDHKQLNEAVRGNIKLPKVA